MNTSTILFLVLFAIVLLLTGSVMINLYDNIKTSVFTSENVSDMASFHWWIGIISIMTGVVCMIFSIYLINSSTNTTIPTSTSRSLTPFIRF